MRLLSQACALSVFLLSISATAEPPTWPNGPNDDPLEAPPADPGYVKFDQEGLVRGGQWNLWSFVPKKWAQNSKFRQEEIAMGTGIHADRAWQRTTGDRRVKIAVLDSGINWDATDLVMKHYLNKAELQNCKPTQPEGGAADVWDVNNDGIFNIADYTFADDTFAGLTDDAGNQNGILDPGDLIRTCSDGVDDDKNGFTDDISGWDAMWNDNDPYDDTRFGHGTGEARDSAAGGNDGIGDIGVCPNCTVLMVRVGDSFVTDSNDFASGVTFAVDSGASVIQEALGTINMTPYAMQAIEYAHRNNVAIVASAADELSFHHNMPGTANHTLYVHAIVHDNSDAAKSTTFLNYNNCTNYGGQLLLSTPGSGCSSEATGITSGHVGLIYSAALKAELALPLSGEEIRGILIQSVDDIDIPEAADDPTKFASGPGWDLYFGYGRNNARTSVDMVLDDQIPPEADIAEPLWFEPIEVTQRPTVAVMGRVGARVDGKGPRYDNYSWELEVALGVDPKSGWETVASGDAAVGGGPAPAKLTDLDVAALADKIDFDAPLTDPHQYAVTLRLKVTTQQGADTLKNEFRKTIHLIKDPTLLPGYPKYMGTSCETSAKIFDVDSDGKEEIVVATTDGLIHALRADGTEAPGFPITLGRRDEANPDMKNSLGRCAFMEEKADYCTAVGRVDPDVVRQSVMMGIAVGALTGDNTDLSIVAATFDGYVYVFDTAGTLREGWPQRTNPEFSAVTSPSMTLDEGFFGAPVLYDMDSDGDLEIVAAAMDQHVYIWHHDGSPMEGWPVLVKDPIEDQRARIVNTPAIGDVDGDGFPEIVVGTNEIFGAKNAENEARGYLLKHTGASSPENTLEALEDGWPVTPFGLLVNTLPLVGRGVPTNPALADIDGDGIQEIHIDALAFSPQFWTPSGEPWLAPETGEPFDNFGFGNKSNSVDAPAYTLMNHGTFARLDDNDTIDFIKGTAGFDFALTFAEGGKRAVFDHHLSAWDGMSGKYLKYWPRVVEDWQFFMNPTVVDLNGDGHPEVLNGSGGYVLHAFDFKGKEPAGFPKMLSGWITSAPTFGDLTGSGTWDVVDMTRDGWIFAWATDGPVSKSAIQWQTMSHGFHNTSNFDQPVAQYNDYPEEPATGGDTTGGDTTGGDTGGDTTGGDTGGDTTGGGDVATTEPPADDSGCTTGSSSRPTGALLLVLVLFGMAIIRKRRRA